MAIALLGIDTGGTFTDFVLYRDDSLTVHKVLSSPVAPQDAIMAGIRDLGLEPDLTRGNLVIIHGTTVATNAVLQGKGARTVYITNRGLKDVLRIGRQTRTALYALTPQAAASPFADELMLEVDCRLGADGRIVTRLEPTALARLRRSVTALKPDAIAINLLFSFLDPTHEIEIERLFTDDYFVSRSSYVLPEYREYERGITTWLNAWLGPLIHHYLRQLNRLMYPSSLSIMQSSGLTIAADQAATRAVNLLLSGPAGGLAAAEYLGKQLGSPRLITFDMGGTSTDVALLDGRIKLTNTGRLATFPIGVPMADIHTIGAGGGSIAYIDEGGLLQVGPASAGADPGPACYGRGGLLPTVTDANLILGRLRQGAFLGGRMHLDHGAAGNALAPLAKRLAIDTTELAFGIVQIANEHMISALRVVSLQRGFDPREFTLVCFGGAGGLHFCDLAEALDITKAVVPVHSGVLSAFGMLVAAPGREMVQTLTASLTSIRAEVLEQHFAELIDRGQRELRQEGIEDAAAGRSLDLRYQGQTYTLNIPFTDVPASIADFHAAHRQRYGHDLDRVVELVNLRVNLAATRPQISLPLAAPMTPSAEKEQLDLPGIGHPVRLVARGRLGPGSHIAGPALVTEPHSTTLIKAGWSAESDRAGNLILRRGGVT